MIKSWTLEHFKSVYEKTTLEMAPLTIFAGANSSGKSTLIQSLLLTAQTLQSPVTGRPIILNGHIVRLGVFDDVVSNGFESDDVGIGFELGRVVGLDSLRQFYPRIPHSMAQAKNLASVSSFECYFTFSSRGPELEKEVRQLQPVLEECSVKVNSEEAEKPIEELLIRRASRESDERLAKFHLTNEQLSKLEPALLEYELVKPSSYTPTSRSYFGAPKSGRAVGVSVEHFLPGRIQVLFNVVEEQAKQIGDVLTSGQPFRINEVEPFFDTLDVSDFKRVVLEILESLYKEVSGETDVAVTLKIHRVSIETFRKSIDELSENFSSENLRNSLSASSSIRRLLFQKFSENLTSLYRAIRGQRPPEYTFAFAPLPELSSYGIQHIQSFFSRQLKYLGPLRDEPKPVYPLAGATDPKDIGFKGEHTAAVLEVHRHTIVSYIPPSAIGNNDVNPTFVRDSLGHAVLDWLEYMGVASDVVTIDKGKLGHELKVAAYEGESLHDLTHVGVGVSQVLPILVLSLLADIGSTLIFEQPELHLHPRVQTRLADFFFSMAALQKQCIVETHSEYLINRLRYRAAVSESDDVSKNTIMYFVEKAAGHSTYKPIRINRFGVIEDWPKGFFDENEENATNILKAAMKKRKKEKSRQE